MRRTRYRFIVEHDHLPEPRPIDVLAYSREGAVVVLERHGYYSIEAVARSRPRSPERRWKLDQAALREAIAMLGIDWPVEVKITQHAGGRYGAHTLQGMRHKITVKGWLTPEAAGQTLWHELTHAMQSERTAARADARDVAAVVTAWRAAPERRGNYYTRPIEVEARKYEAWNDACPLALPNTTR